MRSVFLDRAAGGLLAAPVLLVSFGATIAAAPTFAASADDQAQAAAKRGGAVVSIGGLPAGSKANGTLKGNGVSRQLRGKRVKVAGLRPGVYRVRLARTKVRRSAGGVKKGAVLVPSKTKGSVRMRVRAGRTTKVKALYGSILNPNVKKLSSRHLVAVSGNPDDPTAVVISGRPKLKIGSILSMAPSTRLPRGLLAKTTKILRRGNRTTVSIIAVSPFQAVPVGEFSVPLREGVSPAQTSVAGCGGPSGISPSRTIRDPRFEGSWNTIRAFSQDIPVGVRAKVLFTLDVGVTATGALGLKCSRTADVGVSGLAGPVPVTAGLGGGLSASAAAGGRFQANGSVRMGMGLSTTGPTATPDVSISNPSFRFSAQKFAQASASLESSIYLGIGVSNVSLTGRLGSSLDFNARPGSCSWDANLGQFYARGKVLAVDIDTPKTSPLASRNLWKQGCGGNAGSGSGGPGGGGGATGGGGTARFSEVAAGNWHTCGVKLDSTVACWGLSFYGATSPPGGTFTSVSAGTGFACGLRTGGSISCWGGNNVGQLAHPAGTYNVLSVGRAHACGVSSGGAVACWGENVDGQATAPAGSFKSVSAGSGHTCGLKTDDTAACWGYNFAGQATPPSGTFKSVTAGGYHSCGIRPDDTVTCWGSATHGKTTPPSGGFRAVSGGLDHSCGLRTDYSVTCWGYDDDGQSAAPSGTFRSVSAGGHHTCGLRTDGSVACWGKADEGQLSPP